MTFTEANTVEKMILDMVALQRGGVPSAWKEEKYPHHRGRIVADIDEIVKKVRFPDWQRTSQGERLVQKELRRTLLKYHLHRDQELFEKAYGHIRQYY